VTAVLQGGMACATMTQWKRTITAACLIWLTGCSQFEGTLRVESCIDGYRGREITGLALSPSGRKLAVIVHGEHSDYLDLHDIQTGVVRRIRPRKKVRAFGFRQPVFIDEQRLFCAARAATDGRAIFYQGPPWAFDLESGREWNSPQDDAAGLSKFLGGRKLFKRGHCLALAVSEGGRCRAWLTMKRRDDGQAHARSPWREQPIVRSPAISVALDGPRFVTAIYHFSDRVTERLICIDLRSGKQLWQARTGPRAWHLMAAAGVVAAVGDSKVTVHRMSDGKQLGWLIVDTGVNSLAISADGTRLAIITQQGRILLIRLPPAAPRLLALASS